MIESSKFIQNQALIYCIDNRNVQLSDLYNYCPIELKNLSGQENLTQGFVKTRLKKISFPTQILG